MTSLKIYRVLSFILLPFAAFLSLNLIGSLLASLSNPLLLLTTFIMACAPVYIFTSSWFFFNCIRKDKKCKPSLKDWIKVNAVVTLVFIAFMLLSCIGFLFLFNNPTVFNEIMSKMPSRQMPGMQQLNVTQVLQVMKVFASIMLPFSLILLVHIIFTFRFIKIYGYLFEEA
jgi:hypothetical protein